MRTRTIEAGGIKIGGGNPIVIQSMTTTDTRDVKATAAQINELDDAGCELARVAVSDMESAAAVSEIKKLIRIPLVADVHFDYRLAVAAVTNGADKLRINPGNIGGIDKIKQIVSVCNERNVPIRIGVNSGSLEKKILAYYGGVTPEAIVESAVNNVRMFEELGFDKIIVSVKSSDVPATVEAYTLLSEKIDYPLHVGVTEAGNAYSGAIKSAVGIGTLLLKGVGDTIRVSLTGDPVEEIRAAREILKATGARNFGVEIISCPTCGRTYPGLAELAEFIEKNTRHIKKHIKIAVMGCEVNGPGEAREADIGIASGKTGWSIFANGKCVKKIPRPDAAAEDMLNVSTGDSPDTPYPERLIAEFFEILEKLP